MKNKVNECEKEEIEFIKSLSITEKFYKILTEAESLSLSNTIENINMGIKYYTEHFFPEGNIQIQITPYKETGKGEKKTGLDIEVYQNGEKIGLNSLSGGEYDRCLLIVFLSFNNIINNDIIMLDECLSSLNGELVEEIVDILKVNLKDKLILITLHQANTGNFDKVIDIESI
jgi:DNA repair exonuclease SbcCD ATPase subunit